MKQYTKSIDGSAVIKTLNQIVIERDGMNIYNPTEEMILANGWEEYVVPVVERVEADLLTDAKEVKRMEIIDYDSSKEVNIFRIQGKEVWLDKATRTGLMLRFQAEDALGLIETSLWYGGQQFALSLENAIQMLYALEVYASQCYDNTQRHLAEVDKLEAIEEVESYIYRVGYPVKLEF